MRQRLSLVLLATAVIACAATFGGHIFALLARMPADVGVTPVDVTAAPQPTAAIRARVAGLFAAGAVRTTPVPTVVELDATHRGQADRGREVFETNAGCTGCHSLGGPRKIGPDLSAIGVKYGRQALLDNISRPSQAIAPEYTMTMLTLRNGDHLIGILAEDTPDRVVVKTGGEGQTVVKPADIALREPSRISLMPEGLLNDVTDQQVADLLEFLSTLKDSAPHR